MPKMSLSVPHALDQEQAVERLKKFIPRVREHYQGQVKNIEETWEGNMLTFGFTTLGVQIKGNITVEEAEAKFEGDLPFAAMMFKGRIEKSIRDDLTKLLS